MHARAPTHTYKPTCFSYSCLPQPSNSYPHVCPVFTFPFLQDAIVANSFFEIPIPFVIKRGDVEAGFAASDHIIEGEMRVGAQVINLSLLLLEDNLFPLAE